MNHKKGNSREQLFFTSFEQQVGSDSFARLVNLFVDHLPLEELGFKNIRLNVEGNEPYHQSDLFKLLVYGQGFGL